MENTYWEGVSKVGAGCPPGVVPEVIPAKYLGEGTNNHRQYFELVQKRGNE